MHVSFYKYLFAIILSLSTDQSYGEDGRFNIQTDTDQYQ